MHSYSNTCINRAGLACLSSEQQCVLYSQIQISYDPKCVYKHRSLFILQNNNCDSFWNRNQEGPSPSKTKCLTLGVEVCVFWGGGAQSGTVELLIEDRL